MGLSPDRCPKSGDLRHRPHVVGQSSRVYEHGTELRIVCSACGRHGYALMRDADNRWGRRGPPWRKETDGGIDHAQGTGV
jgi:hypothetical protein